MNCRQITEYLILLIFALLSISYCTIFEKNINIKFHDIGNLQIHSEVQLDSVNIGEVNSIKRFNDSSLVTIQIYPKYKDIIREKSKFYLLSKDDDSYIVCRILDKNSPTIESEVIVNGYSETNYWVDIGAKELGNIFKKGLKKLKHFLEPKDVKKSEMNSNNNKPIRD
jgi:hypothetical protein